MLVVISDLHFVDETTGSHNVPLGAFKDVFLSDIASLAKAKEAKEIKLLLLGDIVDLLRTEQWFEDDPDDRPWGKNGIADIPDPRPGSATEKRCLSILGKIPKGWVKPRTAENTILYKNWETFKFFRDIAGTLKKQYRLNRPVQVIYVPGNHDRLCNLYPSLRDWMRQALGLTINPDTVDGNPKSGSWWYRYDFKDENYGVYARHGHQFGALDYGGENDHSRPAQLKACVGDIFTTEFAVKIPYLLKKDKRATTALVESLEDMDNVRPLSSVVEWFYYQVKSLDQGPSREALEEAFKSVVEQILDIDLIKEWRTSKSHLDDLLRVASSGWLKWITKGAINALGANTLFPVFIRGSESSSEPEKDELAKGAYYEQIWRSNKAIQLILYGHTHFPLLVPLDRLDNRDIMYINTGTWRDRIYRTIKMDKSPDFISAKQMTYVVAYRKDEDKDGKTRGTNSYEVWTGHKRKV